MKAAVQVTTSVTTVLAASFGRTFIIIQNVSDEDIYLGITSDGTTLTTANGLLLEPGDWLIVDDIRGGAFTNAIQAIHGGTGNKELRVQSE